MLLNEMIGKIRVELQDKDTALFDEDDVNRAIDKAVLAMSRLLPNRKILETRLTRDIDDETLTISSNTGTLTYKPVKANSLAIPSKTEDTDFEVNLLTGVVTEIGSGLADTDYTVDYELDPGKLDISSILEDYIKIEQVEYPVGDNPPTIVTFDILGDFLCLRGETNFTDDDKLRIIYLDKWTAPTLSAEGTYQPHLDGVVIVGSAGYALLFKAEKYLQLAADTTGTLITTLAGITDLTLSASGLTAPTAPTLTDVTAPTSHTVSEPSAPSLPSAPTAPNAPTPSYTDAETAIDLVGGSTFEAANTQITDALDKIDSGITVINAATTGEDVAAIYAKYADTIMEGAKVRVQESLARLEQIAKALDLYASEVTSYGSEVNSFAQEMSGTVGKYREEINSEALNIQNVSVNVAKYQQELYEESLKVDKYREQVNGYEAEVAEYSQQVASYTAQANAIANYAVRVSAEIEHYFNISGRYLAAGQAKVNEFFVMLGAKPEFPTQKASSEQW